MGAPLSIWIGRAGSGKTSRLYDRLVQHAQKGERATLIVAEQYTFEAEKALCSRLGGLLGVQVLSFSRLCEQVLREQGNLLPVIGGPGRRMILKKAALNHRNELKLFGRVAESRGFVERMDDIVTRCKQSGAAPEDLPELLSRAGEFSHVRVTGLMTIPPAETKPGENRNYFRRMHDLFVDIRRKKYNNVLMNELSMGMSSDYADAVRCGATIVRLGTALFGARNYDKAGGTPDGTLR